MKKIINRTTKGRCRYLVEVTDKIEWNDVQDATQQTQQYFKLLNTGEYYEIHQVIGGLTLYKYEEEEIRAVSEFPFVTVGECVVDGGVKRRKFWWCSKEHQEEIKKALPKQCVANASEMRQFWK